MPTRKSDGTEEQAATPETEGREPGADLAGPGEEPLPPAGAESVRDSEGSAPEEAPAPETVSVDEQPEASLDPALTAQERPEPTPPPTPEPPADDDTHEEGHDEGGMSFAAWALTVLLLLLAGAALGIWGAPRLAPHLPSGLARVADWLTPGAREAEAELAALEARVDQRLGGVDTRLADLPNAGDLDSRIAAAKAELEATLRGDVERLQQQLGQADGAEVGQRLGRLESSIEGQAAELETLKGQLSVPAAGGQLGAEAENQIDVYRAELDGLRAEVGTLQDRVGSLAARIDEVDADADRQIATAQAKVAEIQSEADTALSAAEVEADVALIRAAVASGQPFAEPVRRLAESGLTVPEGLQAAAASGVATMGALRDRFPDAAYAAIEASILAGAGDGIVARSRAYLEAQVASRSLTPKEGTDPDAVLSRMEDKLRNDDLKGVLAEAESLPSEAAAAMADWLDAARRRAGAVEALASLDAAAPATN
jgi:hypothetical protein